MRSSHASRETVGQGGWRVGLSQARRSGVVAAALVLGGALSASAASKESTSARNANFKMVPGGGSNASIGDVSVLEGNSGNTDAEFTVTLSGAAGSPVTVDFATADGTATLGDNDYLATSGTLTFAPGETTRIVPVSVVGDLAVEADEGFFVNISNLSGGGSISDAQGDGTILNDDGSGGVPDLLELVHGYSTRRSLEAVRGVEKIDTYHIAQKPQSSYEVVVDDVSGDLVPLGLDRLDGDGSTVLQSALAAGTGPARSLRWANTTTTEVTDETVRVTSGGCTTDCGADDVYRVRAYETTYAVPRYNNSGTQITILLLQNPTDATINANVFFWDASGSLVATQSMAVPPKNVVVLNTSGVPGVNNTSGSISVASDGRYGELTGKTVALEVATGFSFDSPMIVRQR